MIIADLSDGFQAHVAACDGLLVVLLKHQRTDEANDGVVIGKDADDIRPPLHLFVQPLKGIGGMELVPVAFWKAI